MKINDEEKRCKVCQYLYPSVIRQDQFCFNAHSEKRLEPVSDDGSCGHWVKIKTKI